MTVAPNSCKHHGLDYGANRSLQHTFAIVWFTLLRTYFLIEILTFIHLPFIFFIFFWFIFTYFAYFFFHLSSCLAVLCLPVWPAAAFGSVSSFFVHRCLHLCGVHSGPGNVLFDLHQRMTNRQRYELCQEQIFGNRCRRVSWLHIFFGTSEFNIAIMFKPAQDNWYPSLAGVL